MRILVVLITLILSGCAGFGVIAPEQRIGDVKKNVDGQYFPKNKEDVKRDIEMLGGDSNDITVEIDNDIERWTYDKASWCGVLVIVIPLILPVCEETHVYEFKDDELVSTTYDVEELYGKFCSIYPFLGSEAGGFCYPLD